jgi:CRP-like cAMP-binding protein
MAVTAELLKKFPLLNALPDAALSQLAENSTMSRWNRRAIILTAGTQENSLCFLFEGRLQGVDFTIDGREVGLFFVEPGEFCGELALFDFQPQPEHVIALAPSVTVTIPLAVMRNAISHQPKILTALGTKLAYRIRQMNFQRSLLALPNISQRVCCQLWSLIPDKDSSQETAREINNPPTHMEIAIMLNVSRETVSRVFQNLQSEGIVKRNGSVSLKILNFSALKQLAQTNTSK